MIGMLKEIAVKYQVDRLSEFIDSSRTTLSSAKTNNVDIIKEHVALADESLGDAISALKYDKFDQAQIACRVGFMQIGLAQMLLRFGRQADQYLQKTLEIAPGRKLNEAEEPLSYLASCLAEMKVVIEYGNLKVGDRGQSMLDRSMDYYNDALSLLKESDVVLAKRSAQAGLLHLFWASEVISQDNSRPLPGWRGLSNPMLGSPLRRGNELMAALMEVRSRVMQSDDPAVSSARIYYEKAVREYSQALQALSKNNMSHARATVTKAFRELEQARQMFVDELMVENDGIAEIDQIKLARVPLADVAALIADVQAMLAVSIISEATMDAVRRRLLALEERYLKALKFYEAANYDSAMKQTADALFDLDCIQQMLNKKTAEID